MEVRHAQEVANATHVHSSPTFTCGSNMKLNRLRFELGHTCFDHMLHCIPISSLIPHARSLVQWENITFYALRGAMVRPMLTMGAVAARTFCQPVQ